MLLYHGSSTGNLQCLQPFTADHGKPYVYFSTIETAACFYAVNMVARPYYLFPYNCDPTGKAVYTELYPNAFEETYSGQRGYLYTCEVPEESLLRFPSDPNTRLSAGPVPIARVETIGNLYEWFLKRAGDGKLTVQRFETLTPAMQSCWNGKVLEDLRAADSASEAKNAFAAFVQQKLPLVWERFRSEMEF
jgi:hypothetical protein